MKNTFSVTRNGAQVMAGNVESQPAKSQPNEKNKPAAEVPIDNLPILSNAAIVKDQSISTLADQLKISGVSLSTLRGDGINRVSLDQEQAGQKSSIDYQKNSFVPHRTYTDYENFIGFSQESPQIIMLTDFQPIYNFTNFLNSSGEFFYSQLDIRNVKKHNIHHIVEFNKNLSDRFELELGKKITDFNSKISTAERYLSFLKNTVKITDLLKTRLDLRNQLYDVRSSQVVDEYFNEFSQSTETSARDLVTRNLLQNFNVSGVFQRFGFSVENVRSQFLSTKIGLQLLLETKNIVKYCSKSLLDRSTSKQQQDTSPNKILKDAFSNFEFIKIFDNSLSFLRSVSPTTQIAYGQGRFILAAQLEIDKLEKRFQDSSFYVGSEALKTEEIRIAALASIISRELRLSMALAKPEVQAVLKAKYNYTTSLTEGNRPVFDAIFGNIGENIGEFTSNETYTNSLTSLFQTKVNSLTLLPFEEKPVKSDLGLFLSGCDYYVDIVYNITNSKFNTSRLEQLASTLKTAIDNFGSIVNKLNLLCVDVPNTDADSSSNSTSKKNENPLLYVDQVLESLLLSFKKEVPAVSIFCLARQNAKFRALLFYYLILDNSNLALRQYLEKKINDLFLELVPFQQAINPDGTGIFKAHPISSGVCEYLKNSDLVNKIKFYLNNQVQGTNYTLYSGYTDTTMSMAIFNMIVSLLFQFSKTEIIGRTEDGVKIFHTKVNLPSEAARHQDSSAFKTSKSEIYSRLSAEITTTQHSIFFLLNALKLLHSNISAFISSINDASSLELLSGFKTLIGNENVLKFAFSKYQVGLAQNALRNVTQKLRETSPTQTRNNINKLKLLDEYSLNKKLKTAIESYFYADEFSSYKASNHKILTVGLPIGLIQKLSERASFEQLEGLQSNREDILKINVHKVDQFNPDIIWKPKSFLFEMSRFPISNESLLREFKQLVENIDDLIKYVPSRVCRLDERGAETQYLVPNMGESGAFDSKYSFLSDQQKNDIYKNHVVSMLLDFYLKTMAGISTDDLDFHVSNQEKNYLDQGFLELLTNQHIGNFLSSRPQSSDFQFTKGRLFYNFKDYNEDSDSKVGKSEIDALSGYTNDAAINKPIIDSRQALSDLKKSEIFPLLHQLSVISEFARTQSNAANPDKVLRNLFLPKKFDRIFNIIFDVNTFEIDHIATASTPQGSEALDSLLREGKVSIVGNVSLGEKPKYFFKNRNRTENEVFFEKYIVAVETFFEEES